MQLLVPESLSTVLSHVKIVGATLALGSSIVSGMWYMVYQPYQQARSGSGWAGVMHGVCIGAGRLVAEVGCSFLHIIGQFAEGMGTGIRTATYIDMPLERTLIMKPQSLTHGIVSGTMMFSADCRAAAKNIVCLPLQGWAEQGVIGALKGTACGISGLFLPIAGVMDLMAHATFGVGAELENLGARAGRGQGGRRPRRNHVQVCPFANLAKAWSLPTLSVPTHSCAHGPSQAQACRRRV
jgi:hypothetical protein